MSRICSMFDRSKSWYYDTLASAARVQEYEQMIVTEVRKIREQHPYYGLRKFWHQLARDGIQIGRDKLYKILKKNSLLRSRHYKKVRTSYPGIYDAGFENLVKGLVIDHPDQVWSTDITYVHTTDGILYVSAIMDLYSRKIISYEVSNNLRTDGSLACLEKALASVSDPGGAIHHSDHGTQYCSYRYLNKLQSNGLLVSFTGKNHCYDNARMERFFNTLKHEYGLSGVVRTKKVASLLISQAIQDYNYERLHAAINYLKPCEMYDAA